MFSIVYKVVFSEIPYVVIAIVACDPGEYFEECLRSSINQSYENYKVLVLDTGSESVSQTVAEIAPDAFYKRLPVGIGYSRAANSIFSLVEGATHYLFMHDDTVLDQDTVKNLLEGSYKYNCGISGPKVLYLTDDSKIQSVGYLTDRFMVPISLSEPDEIDQGQYDQDKEVIAVSGAAMLIRSDLFKTLEGFDSNLTLFGEDTDICVRARTTGATVYYVHDAKVKHLAAASTFRRKITVTGYPGGFEALRYSEIKTALCVYSPFRAFVMFLIILSFSIAEVMISYLMRKNSRGSSVMRVLNRTFSSFELIRAQRKKVQSKKTVTDRYLRSLQISSTGRINRIINARYRGRGVQFSKSNRHFLMIAVALLLILIFSLRNTLLYGFVFNNFYTINSPTDLIHQYFHLNGFHNFNLISPPINLFIGLIGIVFFNSSSIGYLALGLLLVYLIIKNLYSLTEFLIPKVSIPSSLLISTLILILLISSVFLRSFNSGDYAFLSVVAICPWIALKCLTNSKLIGSNIIKISLALYLLDGLAIYLPLIVITLGISLAIFIGTLKVANTNGIFDWIVAKKSQSNPYCRIVCYTVLSSGLATLFSIPWSYYTMKDIFSRSIYVSSVTSLSWDNFMVGGITGKLLFALLVISLPSLFFIRSKAQLLISYGYILLLIALMLKLISSKGYFLVSGFSEINGMCFISISLIISGMVISLSYDLSNRKLSLNHVVTIIAILITVLLALVSIPSIFSGNGDLSESLFAQLPKNVIDSQSNTLYIDSVGDIPGLKYLIFHDLNSHYVGSNEIGFKTFNSSLSLSSYNGVNDAMSAQIVSILNEIERNGTVTAGLEFSKLNIGWVVVVGPASSRGPYINNVVQGLNNQKDLQTYDTGAQSIVLFKNIDYNSTGTAGEYIPSNFTLFKVNILVLNFILFLAVLVLVSLWVLGGLLLSYRKTKADNNQQSEILGT